MLAFSAAIDHVMEFRLRPLWIRLAERSVARPFAWWDRRMRRRAGPPEAESYPAISPRTASTTAGSAEKDSG